MAIAVPSTFLVTGCGDDSPVGGSGGSSDGGNDTGGGGNGNGGTTTVGGAGGEGGVGGGGVANDSCESPAALTIGLMEAVQVQGTVEGATDNTSTFCITALEPAVDVFYELNVVETCKIDMVLEGIGAGFDGVLTLRSDTCEIDGTTPAPQCVNASTGPAESLTTTLDSGTYYIVVTDVGEGSTFSLDISCTPTDCGDFILDPDEECDFGTGADDVPNDGCTDMCGLEPSDPIDTQCGAAIAGAALNINAGTTFVSGSTINGESNENGSCQLLPVAPHLYSKENVIKVRPSISGTMTLTLGEDLNGDAYCGPDPLLEPTFPYQPGCYDRTLYVRTECGSELPADEVACAESAVSWWDVETLTFPVIADTDYFIFADGWLDYTLRGDQSDIGIYDLKIEL